MTDQQVLFDVDSTVAPAKAGHYRTIIADPPWLERGAGQVKRGADRHYALMSTERICALPVSRWAADDAHLYLWVTNNFLPDGLQVMAAWGFRYVTKIDWFKGDLNEDWIDAVLTDAGLDDQSRNKLVAEAEDRMQIGLGQYFRGCTESCLFGVRGLTEYRTHNGKRAQGRTGFHAERGVHSAKPSYIHQIAQLVSHGPYLEMFARRATDGWDAWGNQAPIEG